MLFVDHLGWSHPEQMIINCSMGVGHKEPSQGQNLIIIQTTAVTTETSFTWRVVNWNWIKGSNLGCSGFIPTPLNTRYFVLCHCYAAINIFIKIFNVLVTFSYTSLLYSFSILFYSFYLLYNKNKCYVYCVKLTETHLHIIALLLILIASVVLICNSL